MEFHFGMFVVVLIIVGLMAAVVFLLVFFVRADKNQEKQSLVVSRPPISDAWEDFVRKMSSNDRVATAACREEMGGDDYVTGIISKMVCCGGNKSFTGEMATGMTTLFRGVFVDAISGEETTKIGFVNEGKK